jgi:NTP pyrophosphatase (non-canonical NTP hydrolase)
MTIDEYADWAAGIAGVVASPGNDKLAYLGLGLAGEAGEVAEAIKKLLRDGKLNQDHFVEELGDVVYYWACLCVAAGHRPSDLLT